MGDILGGGGAPAAVTRDLPTELHNIFQVYQKQEPQLAAQAFTQAQQYQPQYLKLNLAGEKQGIAGSPLLNLLNQQATSELQTGGKLTPQEVRDVTQQTRARYAALGNVLGNQALGAELLNRDAATRARLMQEQQFAQGVQQMDLGNVQGLQGVAGPGYMAGVTAPVQPYLNYSQDLYNTNLNSQSAANIAAANKQTGATTGAIGAGGSVLAAAAPALIGL